MGSFVGCWLSRGDVVLFLGITTSEINESLDVGLSLGSDFRMSYDSDVSSVNIG